MKTYLITGAAGFIGSNYLKYVLRLYKNIKVIVLDELTYAGNLGTIKENIQDKRVNFEKGNIKDQVLVKELISKYNIDYIVNFAAESHVDRSIENPQIFLETNILGTQNLLECAKIVWKIKEDENGYPVYREGVKFLQISTDEVYGSLAKDYEESQNLEIPFEIAEKIASDRKLQTYGKDFFTEKTALDPRSPYSASKAGADFIVLAYAETYKMPINITRCSNNYGPYHFPEKLIPLMIKNVLEGKKLPVYGDGKNVRGNMLWNNDCSGKQRRLRR